MLPTTSASFFLFFAARISSIIAGAALSPMACQHVGAAEQGGREASMVKRGEPRAWGAKINYTGTHTNASSDTHAVSRGQANILATQRRAWRETGRYIHLPAE